MATVFSNFFSFGPLCGPTSAPRLVLRLQLRALSRQPLSLTNPTPLGGKGAHTPPPQRNTLPHTANALNGGGDEGPPFHTIPCHAAPCHAMPAMPWLGEARLRLQPRHRRSTHACPGMPYAAMACNAFGTTQTVSIGILRCTVHDTVFLPT